MSKRGTGKSSEDVATGRFSAATTESDEEDERDLDEEDAEDEDEGDEDGEEEDEDEGGDPGPVTVERLRDLGGWEMYRLVDEDEMSTVCTIALRSAEKARVVEYAIWREDEDKEEPGSAGAVEWARDAKEWGDPAREDALRQIAYRYEEDLHVGEERLEFRLVGPPEGWDEDEDEGEEEDGDGDE